MINAIIILFIIFMYFSKDSATIKDIIDTYVEEGENKSKDSGNSIEALITKE